jgi:hypothetical protein
MFLIFFSFGYLGEWTAEKSWCFSMGEDVLFISFLKENSRFHYDIFIHVDNVPCYIIPITLSYSPSPIFMILDTFCYIAFLTSPRLQYHH